MLANDSVQGKITGAVTVENSWMPGQPEESKGLIKIKQTIICGNTEEKYRHNPLIILIDGANIKQSNTCKLLGLITDEKLTWAQHISQIC